MENMENLNSLERDTTSLFAELYFLAQRAIQMGNDDNESSAILQIIEDVRKGKKNLQSALVEAHSIIDSKNEV